MLAEGLHQREAMHVQALPVQIAWRRNAILRQSFWYSDKPIPPFFRTTINVQQAK
jgi:hypothetical protein